MFVLEADRLLRILSDPLRKKDHAMQPAFNEVDGDADRRPRRLVPGHLKDVRGETDDMGLLVANPTAADQAAMDSIVDRALILDVDLVLPAILVSVDEVLADEPGDFLRLGWFKRVRHFFPR